MAKVGRPLLVVAACLLLWQLTVTFGGMPSFLMPGPLAVGRALLRLWLSGQLLPALVATGTRVLVSFGVAAVGGLMLGLLLSRVKPLSRLVGPAVVGLQSMPSVCWFPLAVLWFGLGEGALLFVGVVGALFAVAVATESGIRNVQPAYIWAGRTMGARGVALYGRVVLPASLPQLLSGLRLGWSFTWRSLMAAELLSANRGLGQLLTVGRELADAAQVMTVVLVILVIGILVEHLLFARAERQVRRRWGLEGAA
jgi:NitT/TauT family transport system permease protein